MSDQEILAPPTAGSRVAHGTKVLDLTDPGWENRIDLDRFDLDHMERCILGQLYGDFMVVYYVDLGRGSVRSMPEQLRRAVLNAGPTAFGFAVGGRPEDYNKTKDDLSVEWERVVLKKRRAAK